MTDLRITYRQRNPLPKVPTFIGYCCREWVLAYMHKGTTCGLCGEKPTYLRPDPHFVEHIKNGDQT